MDKMIKDALIDDIFFNMVDRFEINTRSKMERSLIQFSKVLADCGIEKTPKQIREDYQRRL